MSIPLPSLDDQSWLDLVGYGRALIPLSDPGWTDHNVHDPGITIIELLAWIAEMDLYRLDRIPDRHRLKFLALTDNLPKPPLPAMAILGISLKPEQNRLTLPATTEFEGTGASETDVRFCTTKEVALDCMQLSSVQIQNDESWREVTGFETRNETIFLLGEEPDVNSALYLGFEGASEDCYPARTENGERVLSLYFDLVGPRTGRKERDRLLREEDKRQSACRKHRDDPRCKPESAVNELVKGGGRDHNDLKHHDVHTVWEYAAMEDGDLVWLPLPVDDQTRSLSLTGFVRISLPGNLAPISIGRSTGELYYLRCRMAGGHYDAPPRAFCILPNAVEAIQAVPVIETMPIAKDAMITGQVPDPGSQAHPNMSFNVNGEIQSLKFEDEKSNCPSFTLLGFEFNPESGGRLLLEATTIGFGTGAPHQRLTVPGAPLVLPTLRLYTLESLGWRNWELRSDFVSSEPQDLHYTVNPSTGEIAFGDGDKGCAPPRDSRIMVSCRTTLAEDGNLDATADWKLADSQDGDVLAGSSGVTRNGALLVAPDKVAERIETIECPAGATGGEAAELLPHAVGRAIRNRESTIRSVTLQDFEKLAFSTPGARLARVTARANLHPRFPCLRASGIVTVIIVPFLPKRQPAPSPGLKRLVAAYLRQHRIIGTRVEVVGPDYIEVAVRARVRAFDGVDPQLLRQRIIESLDRFLHPLTGGPDGSGWPFGRDVYRAEVIQVIDEISGVDHVLDLDLIPDGCEAQCGNICLAPTWLVTAGPHDIRIVRGGYASA